MKKLIPVLLLSLFSTIAWAESVKYPNTESSSYSCVLLTENPVFFKYEVTTSHFGAVRGFIEYATLGVDQVKLIESPQIDKNDEAESFLLTVEGGLYFYEISLRQQPSAKQEEQDYLELRIAVMYHQASAIDGGFSEHNGDLNNLSAGKCTIL